MDWQADVATFMREVKSLDLPAKPVKHQVFLTKELCKALMTEELGELTQAMDQDNLVEIADGLADLLYVTLYTANSYGLDMQPIWSEVQRSNMTKKGGDRRADGKLLKPEGYEPPRLEPILEELSR